MNNYPTLILDRGDSRLFQFPDCSNSWLIKVKAAETDWPSISDILDSNLHTIVQNWKLLYFTTLYLTVMYSTAKIIESHTTDKGFTGSHRLNIFWLTNIDDIYRTKHIFRRCMFYQKIMIKKQAVMISFSTEISHRYMWHTWCRKGLMS